MVVMTIMMAAAQNSPLFLGFDFSTQQVKSASFCLLIHPAAARRARARACPQAERVIAQARKWDRSLQMSEFRTVYETDTRLRPVHV